MIENTPKSHFLKNIELPNLLYFISIAISFLSDIAYPLSIRVSDELLFLSKKLQSNNTHKVK